MIIKAFNKLDEKTTKEIKEVESICKDYDKLNGNLFLDASANFDTEVKSVFLLFEEEKLVSLVTMFIPTREEAEISAYTLPEHRRNGYFKKLLEAAVAEIKRYGIPSLLLVCESHSIAGKAAVESLNANHDFTEYSLRYKEPSGNWDSNKPMKLKLIKAEVKDLETIVQLSIDIFDDDYESAKTFVAKCFEADNRLQYIAWLDEKPIGMGSIYLGEGTAYIYGLGIIPQYQGKGCGKEMLGLILKAIKGIGIEHIIIEVESDNDNAFSLYKKCGFELATSFNYYRKEV